MSNQLIEKKDEAVEVISHDVAPLTVNTDARAYARLGWLIVLLGVGGFFLWAFFAPLDKGVPVVGTVASEGNRKTVQYLQGGIIEEILVKDGDQVKAGQTLVRMNDVQPRAQVDMVSSQLLADRAAEARLIAERAGKKTVAYPESLLSKRNDPATATAIALQDQLLLARQMALQNEMAAYEQNVAGLKSQLIGLTASRDSNKEQAAILKEQVENLRDLAKDGYVARSRLLDVERNYAQVNGSIAEINGNLGHYQRQIGEISARRQQRLQEYQKEINTLLADVQRDREVAETKLRALQADLENVNVKSPVDGVVVGLNVFTRGGVVQSGFHMMDVVPNGEAFVVEAQLPVNLIDKVHVGLPVELIFSAFNTNKTPHIAGVLSQVSADRTTDERTGAAYYKIRAKVSPEGLKTIAHKKLDVQPGMPVEMFIKTGERSMISYLLKPVMDRAKTSLTEE
nr:HlyD family type I secretion periplasmic adaptor subunit [uncultured Duganella sp.]